MCLFSTPHPPRIYRRNVPSLASVSLAAPPPLPPPVITTASTSTQQETPARPDSAGKPASRTGTPTSVTSPTQPESIPNTPIRTVFPSQMFNGTSANAAPATEDGQATVVSPPNVISTAVELVRMRSRAAASIQPIVLPSGTTNAQFVGDVAIMETQTSFALEHAHIVPQFMPFPSQDPVC